MPYVIFYQWWLDSRTTIIVGNTVKLSNLHYILAITSHVLNPQAHKELDSLLQIFSFVFHYLVSDLFIFFSNSSTSHLNKILISMF